MKYLLDICLVGAMLLVLYVTDGYWQLFAFLPFVALLISINPSEEKRSKEFGPQPGGRFDQPMKYIVTDSEGKENDVESICPVQFAGKWAHFTDEITEYGYHPHQSFYKPRIIEEKIAVIDVDKEMSKLN